MTKTPVPAPPAIPSPGRTRATLITVGLLLSFLLGIAIAFILMPRSTSATDASVPKPPSTRIEAYIDGRSRLIIQGKTIQWHNIEWSLPGRALDQNLPTVIDDVQWFPQWPNPDPAPAEKRDAKNYSSKFESLNHPLPASSAQVQIKPINGRGKTFIFQQPSPGNDYKLIIEFNDNAFKGPAYYIVDVIY